MSAHSARDAHVLASLARLDFRALQQLAIELSALDHTQGVRSSAGRVGVPRGERSPDALEDAESAVDRGVVRRQRAARARMTALPEELRPIAAWLATKARLSDGPSTWPLELARALGPRNYVQAEQRAAEAARNTKERFRTLRGSATRTPTAETTRAINSARTALNDANDRHGVLMAELTQWGIKRFAELIEASQRRDGPRAS